MDMCMILVVFYDTSDAGDISDIHNYLMKEIMA